MKKKFILGCFFSLLALSLFAQSNVNSVVPMKKGTDGSAGTNGQYVLFGLWPQSKKADSVTIDNSKSEKVNGWVCYKGSDNSYYVKVTSKPYDDYKFNDGTNIESGKDYYFRLDPIKWRVVDNNYQGGKLLVSEYILCSGSFSAADKDRKINGKKINLNDYEKSSVRAWLNGLNGSEYGVEDFTNKGFLNIAFSADDIKNIKTVNPEKDKVFLLSQEEVTNKNYGFADYKDSDKSRMRKTTDYARATVAYSNPENEFMNNGWWWLRSPSSSFNNFARGVKYDGSANMNYSIAPDRRAGGFVPALSVSF